MFSYAIIVMYNLLCIFLVINSFYIIVREVLKFSVAFSLQLFMVYRREGEWCNTGITVV